jgi:ParB family transcriptional regulator, chromosome partitioning protein
VHDPATVARLAHQEAEHPAPVMEPEPEEETAEAAAKRRAEFEQRQKEHEAEQQRREEERKAEFERQEKEYEAERKKREKLAKTREATFERILDNAPATFTPAQLRTFLRLIVEIDPYSFLEEVASYFAGDDENARQTEEEIVLAALTSTADDKLTGFALRLALTHHVAIPRDGEPDPLTEAAEVFAPAQPKPSKSKPSSKPTLVKAVPKKTAAKKQKAA